MIYGSLNPSLLFFFSSRYLLRLHLRAIAMFSNISEHLFFLSTCRLFFVSVALSFFIPSINIRFHLHLYSFILGSVAIQLCPYVFVRIVCKMENLLTFLKDHVFAARFLIIFVWLESRSYIRQNRCGHYLSNFYNGSILFCHSVRIRPKRWISVSRTEFSLDFIRRLDTKSSTSTV